MKIAVIGASGLIGNKLVDRLAADGHDVVAASRRTGVDVIDVRPPHTETGLVDRALAGTAPRLPQGLEPSVVATAVLDAIEEGTPELASTDIG